MRQLIKRSKWALVGYTIARSYWVRKRFSAGQIDSISGSTHLGVSSEKSVAYINRQFDDYFRYGKITPDYLAGKHILEGGPGDNLGVGLLFLAHGAARVVAMDKFYSKQDGDQQKKIYIKLREQLDEAQKKRYDAAVDLSKDVVFNEELIKPAYGSGMEEFGDVFEANSFDMVVSRGVVQEIYDTARVFRGIDKVLRPGGLQMHKIDLRDYGTFSSNGHHPLTFLTLSDTVYAMMAKNSDRPSRKTFDSYRKLMKEYGYNAELYVTTIIEYGYPKPPKELNPHKLKIEFGTDYTSTELEMVRKIRPSLAPQFASLSDEDLIATGVFLVARK
jgi:SAM-dependent methyltransferase